MKLTIKLFLVFFIATSAVFAEGEMGNGGRTCTELVCPPPQPLAQSSGDGSNEGTDSTNTQTSDETDDDSMLTIIEDYLNSLFG